MHNTLEERNYWCIWSLISASSLGWGVISVETNLTDASVKVHTTRFSAIPQQFQPSPILVFLVKANCIIHHSFIHLQTCHFWEVSSQGLCVHSCLSWTAYQTLLYFTFITILYDLHKLWSSSLCNIRKGSLRCS